MSYSKKGYIQGERSFEETVEKCCNNPARQRIEASMKILDACDRFKNVYNRKQDSDDGSN